MIKRVSWVAKHMIIKRSQVRAHNGACVSLTTTIMKTRNQRKPTKAGNGGGGCLDENKGSKRGYDNERTNGAAELAGLRREHFISSPLDHACSRIESVDSAQKVSVHGRYYVPVCSPKEVHIRSMEPFIHLVGRRMLSWLQSRVPWGSSLSSPD